MNEKTNKALEYVSALMDGEALTDEMLDAVLADEEALRAWHEYHIIGDCIRQGAAYKYPLPLVQMAMQLYKHRQWATYSSWQSSAKVVIVVAITPDRHQVLQE